MKVLNVIPIFVTLMAAGMLCSTPMQAQTFSKTTNVNFSGPVEIPGGVLPAGDYVFQRPDAQGQVVQIFNKDHTQVMATLLTIPDYRMTPTGNTVILFRERKAGSPPALRAWFYPGENYGNEFVYHMKRAKELAAANQVNVPSVAENTSDTDLKSAHVTEQTPTGGEEEVATNTTPAPVADSPVSNNNQNNSNNLVASNQPLPKTASQVFSVALGGALFIAVGFALGFIRHRRSQGELG